MPACVSNSLLQLLASNINTYRALHNGGGAPAESGAAAAAAAAAADAMEEEAGGRLTEAAVKELVEGVLEAESLEGRRAASMDIDDLLSLLSAFNERGVHFA